MELYASRIHISSLPWDIYFIIWQIMALKDIISLRQVSDKPYLIVLFILKYVDKQNIQ